MNKLNIVLISLLFISCGRVTTLTENSDSCNDNGVIRGTAIISVGYTKNRGNEISTVNTTVTYNNSPSVTFTVNSSNLIPSGFSSNILSLGSFTVTNLKDNNLNVCGTNGNQRCTKATFRVYTTGSIAGFVNTSDPTPYGVPVYSGNLYPTTQVPLNSPGVQVDLISISSNRHTVKLSDFSNPTYSVSSDFTDSGSGNYNMAFNIEYVLLP